MAAINRILVLGATSAIAERWCRLRAAAGDSFLLVARDGDKLAAIAADLTARGATVGTSTEDLADTADADTRFSRWTGTLGGIDTVFLAYGILGDQQEAQSDTAALARGLQANFTSAVVWCELAARAFELAGAGTLVAISSVAGDRGRRTNYAYGAAKAGLSTYLEGMAHRFAGTEITVICVKPGFVATPMTAHIDGRDGPLWATPDQVAEDIEKAVRKRRPEIYTRWFWRFVMLVIRHLPRPIFNKMKI
ncbi:MAG: SDR family NAD(P)-dependent oxidoreductase [Thalassobaculaceae bacterium]|nr:SDR family NAD(P)-dependent oxidoreductase [Thalassobaculaceae bacterium]